MTERNDQSDWLQIYCALIASDESPSTFENLAEVTDLFFAKYKERWANDTNS